MKLFVWVVLSVLFVSSVSIGMYQPTQQDEKTIAALTPLLENLLETDRDQFKPIRDFLDEKRLNLQRWTKKQRFAQTLYDSMVDALDREVLGALEKIEALEKKQEAQAKEQERQKQLREAEENKKINLPIISQEDSDILTIHTPWYVMENDIVMIEFTDIECPFCKRFHDAWTLKKLDADYDIVGYVSLAFPLSFHPSAKDAAIMANCMYKISGFWPYNDYVSMLFGAWKVSQDSIMSVLASERFSWHKRDLISSCYENKETTQAVEDQMNLGKNLWINGTPWTILLHTDTWYYIKLSWALPRDMIESKLKHMIEKDRSALSQPVVKKNMLPWAPSQPRFTDQEKHDVFLETAYIDWHEDAQISIIEFSDVQCPFCQRHTNNGTLDAVHEKYGDDVNIIYGHFPLWFHQHAQKAGEALECVWEMWGDELFWEYKAAVYQAGGDSNPDILFWVADEMWIDTSILEGCLEEERFTQKVKDQMAYGQSLWVTWTPGNVVLNNETWEFVKVSGAVPAASFDGVIEKFLE